MIEVASVPAINGNTPYTACGGAWTPLCVMVVVA